MLIYCLRIEYLILYKFAEKVKYTLLNYETSVEHSMENSKRFNKIKPNINIPFLVFCILIFALGTCTFTL